MAKSNDHVDQHKLFSSSVPKMPEGYYSGDKPNPNLRAFIEEHSEGNPYDPSTDNYDVPVFDRAIETTKATAIYNMHTYWSKKPHDAIRQYIKHYTKPGELVLDPFCGSGGTALAALSEGRKAIAIDRSPAATFITKNYCTPIDIFELERQFELLKAKVFNKIINLYETKCDRCNGNATVSYVITSQVFQCQRCLEKVALFDCVEVESKTAAGKPKNISVCPHCYKKGLNEEIGVRGTKFGIVPVLVSYICNDGCKPSRNERRHDDQNKIKREFFEKYDLKKYELIENEQISEWTPDDRMMNSDGSKECWGLLWRPYLKGIEKSKDFFTKRNLWALAILLDGIDNVIEDNYKDVFKFIFTGTLLNVSRLIQVEKTRRSPNTYYVPPVGKEIAVWTSFETKFKSTIKALPYLNNLPSRNLLVSTQSAIDLSDIKSNSIDYVFTDPPYGYRVQYAELNFLWESWLGFDTNWLKDEIIINEIRGKTVTDWGEGMKGAFAEIYRVLRPGRAVSVCYHDSDPETWMVFQDIMAEAGFVTEQIKSALYIETGQKTHKQTVSDNITQRDLVINFRKPKYGEVSSIELITGEEDKKSFREKVHAIIIDFLNQNSGTSKDRIYDEVISHMVRSGQMEVHNFDELLQQVAEATESSEGLRWYLKDSSLDIIDAAESSKEDAAAENIGAFVSNYLEKHPIAEGVHYSDIFEQFVYTVKDKPRRPLAEWLLDYFFKTDDGTYRLPFSDEEKRLKAEGRSKGTQRRIKRYIAFLQQGVAIPDKERPNDSTLAEWVRHCKRSGLYEQGKLLYEKGGLNLDNLPEEAMVNVEEDYQVCVRLLARGGGVATDAKPKRGRKAIA